VDLWPGATGLFVAKPLHPSFRDDAGLRANWNTIIPQILPHVTSEAAPDLTPYVGNTFQKADLETPPARFPVWRTEVDGNRRHGGSTFKKADLENIPQRDLPFGVPQWMGTGDMAWRTSPTQIAWNALAAEG